MKKDTKVTFKFEGSDKTFTTACTAKFDVPTVQCTTLKMYKNGLDSKVVVAVKNDTEINVVMPEYARDAKTLETMHSLGKGFCNICQYNTAKGKQK